MKKTIFSFLRPAVIMPLPSGMGGVDPMGGAGLLQAFMNNANAYASSMGSYATTTAPTVSAADVVRGIIQLNTGASGGYAVTLPTTAQILGALGASVPQDGSFTKIVTIVNNTSGQTATLTAGDTPTTIVGTATIANNVSRFYVMRVLQSAIVFSNIGTLTL